MAAYFLAKSNGIMPHLKLMKLLYLADRQSLDQYEFPITGDKFYSLDYGPVLSKTKALLDGDVVAGVWDNWIADKADHKVSLKKNITRSELVNLSDADIAIIDEVWHQFGHMNQWEISQYTHDNCKEWKDPKGSSLPINIKEILTALGKDKDIVDNVAQQIEEQEYLRAILS